MEYTEVYDTIRDRLASKTPFALSRLGDGESMILHTNKDTQPKRLNWFLRNQFGFVMERNLVLEIKELVIEGYSNADVIGMPTDHHKESCGAYWTVAEEKLKKLAPRTAEIKRCSIDVHSELLQSGLLGKLIRSQSEIVYISCRDLDEGFKRKFKLDNVYSYHLTEEQRYAVNKVESEYYPKQYNEILEFINNTDCKGKLCLVAAGMLGKYYCWKFKEAGGIALDIGNVADKFAGLITRGAGKGAGKLDDTYKL